MLHTINKAWLKILVNQSCSDFNKNFLVVASDDEECSQIRKTLRDLQISDDSVIHISIATIRKIRYDIQFCKFYNKKFPMYDDILISSELHDIFIKDFLGRHCKRKCC
jgi:hypothetical protein